MAFKNPKMDKGHRTRQYTAQGKKGRRTVRGTNILSLSPSYPPSSVSGDQLFSTINTHVSTSGSVNYTYNRFLEGQIPASFQTKQKTSTVWDPSTKARGRRWMDRAPTPPPLQKREPDSASQPRTIPASRTQGALGSERPEGPGLPGSARRDSRPARPRGSDGAHSPPEGPGAEAGERPPSRPSAWQPRRRGSLPSPQSKRPRAAEARPGQAEDVAQKARE